MHGKCCDIMLFCSINETLYQLNVLVGMRTKECCIRIKCFASGLNQMLILNSTLAELHAKMEEFSSGPIVYMIKPLKQKLHEHYEDFIFLQKVRGVVLFCALKTWLAVYQ